MFNTPSRKQKHTIPVSKLDFPPLPTSGKHVTPYEDQRTVGTTASPSEYSFQTPSTKASSPGRYVWSTSSKKANDDKQSLNNLLVDVVPPSPLHIKGSKLRTYRHSSPTASRLHRAPSYVRACPSPSGQPGHTSPSLKHAPIKFKRNEVIRLHSTIYRFKGLGLSLCNNIL